MPALPEFLTVAENMTGATVALSGDSRAVLFSALAAIAALWQWTTPGGLTPADVDYIDSLLAKANTELMRGMIGQIIAYATAEPPAFVLPCNGSEYGREEYPDLYAAIDPVFHVDADTFQVPDLQGRVIIGTGSGSGLSTYTIDQVGGEETHTLDSGEMPTHYHGLFQSTALAIAPGELPVVIPFLAAAGSTDLAGGGGAHNNIQPFLALNYGIIYA